MDKLRADSALSTCARARARCCSDGWLDIAVTYSSSIGIFVAVNRSANEFAFNVIAAESAAFVPAFADFNGDGRLDFALVANNSVLWYLNNATVASSVSFSRQHVIAEVAESRVVQVADFDGDVRML